MSTYTSTIVNPLHAQPAMRYAELALGLLIVAVVPALFWTGIIWLIAAALGFEPTWAKLASIMLAIATPPTCIWAALAVRD